MHSWNARYATFRRKLIVGQTLLLGLLLAALGWKLYASYVADKQTAQTQTKSFVQAIDAHVTDAVRLVDLALISSVDALKSLEPEQLRSSETVRGLLAASGRSPDASF